MKYLLLGLALGMSSSVNSAAATTANKMDIVFVQSGEEITETISSFISDKIIIENPNNPDSIFELQSKSISETDYETRITLRSIYSDEREVISIETKSDFQNCFGISEVFTTENRIEYDDEYEPIELCIQFENKT